MEINFIQYLRKLYKYMLNNYNLRDILDFNNITCDIFGNVKDYFKQFEDYMINYIVKNTNKIFNYTYFLDDELLRFNYYNFEVGIVFDVDNNKEMIDIILIEFIYWYLYNNLKKILKKEKEKNWDRSIYVKW